MDDQSICPSEDRLGRPYAEDEAPDLLLETVECSSVSVIPSGHHSVLTRDSFYQTSVSLSLLKHLVGC